MEQTFSSLGGISRKVCESFVFGDFMQAELNQMIGLKPATGPSISLLELNPKQIFHFIGSAIFYASLTAIRCELERDDGVRWDRLLDLETCAR
jgi:hypothetical protein